MNSEITIQNLPGYDFNKILTQTFYSYVMPEKLSMQEVNKCNSISESVNIRQWDSSVKYGLVKRLWPIVVLIAVLEVVVGVGLLIPVVLHASDYDRLYATEDSKVISLMSFGGLITLVVSGTMLLTSLLLEKRRVMWFYVLTSIFLCVFIFVLSAMKIHFALLVVERDTYNNIVPARRHFLLSTACAVGIATMLGSVVHFIGNVAVFIYYNLKYVQPILFNHGQ